MPLAAWQTGFLPFETGSGSQVELKLASVVMKAVQARSPGVKTCMPCAGKLGDDADHSKAQVSNLTWDHNFLLPESTKVLGEQFELRKLMQC